MAPQTEGDARHAPWQAGDRYVRQMSLPGFGDRGQARLRASSCLVVGAGGLGSPALLYLAGAGIGRLGIVDGDVVDISNLHRQVVHGTASTGAAKVESAASRVRDLNPDVAVETYDERLDPERAGTLVAEFDVVLDGSDNFPTRYAVNLAAVRAGRPLVWGAVQGTGGQVGVVLPGVGPCYRCTFPSPPPPGAVPSCAEAGVLGSVPGTLGAVMSTEALKILVGLGTSVAQHLLLHDALTQQWDRLPVRRDPSCPVCGSGDRSRARDGLGGSEQVSAADLDLGRVTLIDVREPQEWRAGHIPGARCLPLADLRAGLQGGLPVDRPVVAYCASGVRSAEAVILLERAGVPRPRSLSGGLHAWRRSGLEIAVEVSVPGDEGW
jgi:adenylyltransferase/sulfurtransferase